MKKHESKSEVNWSQKPIIVLSPPTPRKKKKTHQTPSSGSLRCFARAAEPAAAAPAAAHRTTRDAS